MRDPYQWATSRMRICFLCVHVRHLILLKIVYIVNFSHLAHSIEQSKTKKCWGVEKIIKTKRIELKQL